MEMPKRAWKDILARTYKRTWDDNVGLVAAGVAFYGFFALLSLLGLIVLAVLVTCAVAAPLRAQQDQQRIVALVNDDVISLRDLNERMRIVLSTTRLPDNNPEILRAVREQALRSLAAAVEESLARPYRAEAVRRDGDLWAVGARRIQVAEVPGLAGDEAELVVRPDGSVLRVDGETTLRQAPGLDQVGAELGPERVVRAWRVVGDLWEVEATPL